MDISLSWNRLTLTEGTHFLTVFYVLDAAQQYHLILIQLINGQITNNPVNGRTLQIPHNLKLPMPSSRNSNVWTPTHFTEDAKWTQVLN